MYYGYDSKRKTMKVLVKEKGFTEREAWDIVTEIADQSMSWLELAISRKEGKELDWGYLAHCPDCKIIICEYEGGGYMCLNCKNIFYLKRGEE
jgi:hypothetical protein